MLGAIIGDIAGSRFEWHNIKSKDFDLLTYPLITLGIPLIVALLMENKRETKLNKLMEYIVKNGFLWGIGYLTIFITKWLIASLILNTNAVKIAIEQLLFRMNGNEVYPTSRLITLKYNIECFYSPMVNVILFLILAIWTAFFIYYKKGIKQCSIIVPLICIGLIPYLWYIVVSGHSLIHYWFTYRLQAITVFSIMCLMIETIDIKKVKEVKKNGNSSINTML